MPPKMTSGTPGGPKRDPEMSSGDPTRSPGEPNGTPEGQRPNSFTPVHKSRPHLSTIRNPWHPQPPDLLPITSPRYTLPSRQVFSYRCLSLTPTPAPSGVGGLNRPAATAADPEKTNSKRRKRKGRERVELSGAGARRCPTGNASEFDLELSLS